MLFTRCTDCQTTYRITVDELHQADGQVRCGQCEGVFSAFDELTDQLPKRIKSELAESELPDDDSPTDEYRQLSQADTDALLDDEEDDDELGDEALEAVDDELAEALLRKERPDVANDEYSELAVDEFLAAEPDKAGSPWLFESTQQPRTERRSAWMIAALVAVVVLLSQVVHHYRETLAATPIVGTAIQLTYRLAGSPLPNTWDADLIDIVNWETVAGPGPNEQNSLNFTAAIMNRGSFPQPMPLIYLELTDRWEQTIGSRYFEPGEYLADRASSTRVLEPESVADIRLELLDPGPGAYGFEVDLCVEVSDQTLRCKSDRVFQ